MLNTTSSLSLSHVEVWLGSASCAHPSIIQAAGMLLPNYQRSDFSSLLALFLSSYSVISAFAQQWRGAGVSQQAASALPAAPAGIHRRATAGPVRHGGRIQPRWAQEGTVPFTHPRYDVRDRLSDMRHDRSVPFSTLWLRKLKDLIQNVKQPKRWDFHSFLFKYDTNCSVFYFISFSVQSWVVFFIQTQQNEPQNFQTQVEVIYCTKCIKVLIRSVKMNIWFFFTVGRMTPNPDRRWNKCSRTEVRNPPLTICSQYNINDRWSLSFEGILKSFQDFLRSEFSDENVEFWLACQAYRSSSADELQHKARSIYEKFIQPAASREVSVADSCFVSVQKRQKKIWRFCVTGWFAPACAGCSNLLSSGK